MHLMIDVETLGTGPRAPVVEIGGAFFNPIGYGVEHSFTIPLDPDVLMRAGHVPTMDTLTWWRRQSPEAWDRLTKGPRHCPHEAMELLSEQIACRPIFHLWSNGPAFDEALLKTLYDFCDMEVPWAYNAGMDMRTLRRLHPDPDLMSSPPVAHIGEADAIAQALEVQRIFKRYGLKVDE